MASGSTAIAVAPPRTQRPHRRMVRQPVGIHSCAAVAPA